MRMKEEIELILHILEVYVDSVVGISRLKTMINTIM